MPNRNQFLTAEEYNLWFKQYRKRFPEKWRAYRKKWRKKKGYDYDVYRKKYPERAKAHQILNYAVKKGLIKRGDCTICGKVNAQGHHKDYSKPLDVVWLCQQCHSKEHIK